MNTDIYTRGTVKGVVNNYGWAVEIGGHELFGRTYGGTKMLKVHRGQ